MTEHTDDYYYDLAQKYNADVHDIYDEDGIPITRDKLKSKNPKKIQRETSKNTDHLLFLPTQRLSNKLGKIADSLSKQKMSNSDNELKTLHKRGNGSRESIRAEFTTLRSQFRGRKLGTVLEIFQDDIEQ